MAEYDLVIRGGTVATAADTTLCDVGIKDGKVVALGKKLGAGAREIDAAAGWSAGGIEAIAISSSAPRRGRLRR